MLQPVNFQLAHFNIEHAAQVSKDALAVVQQTGQVKEVVEESLRRSQMVQASVAADEAGKVKRRSEDEERENRRDQQEQSFSRPGEEEEISEPETESEAGKIQVKNTSKSFELYA